MKYPFADTPMNRKLASLIHQCSDPSMVVSQEIGKFIFHVIPDASIEKTRRGDVDIVYKSAHIAVINKEEATFGLDKIRDPFGGGSNQDHNLIKSLIDAIRKGDLKEIYRQAPLLVNIRMGSDDEFTYLDHHQFTSRQGENAYSQELDWLIENGNKKAGSIDAPGPIADAVERTINSWSGRKTKEGDPASGMRMFARFGAFNNLPELISNPFDEEGLVRIKDYTRDPDEHAENQDLGNNLGESWRSHPHPEVALNSSIDNYYRDRDDMYSLIRDSYLEAAQTFRDSLISSYKEVLINKFMDQKGSIPETEIISLADKVIGLLDTNTTLAKSLISKTPQATRNKVQMLDFFDGDGQAYTYFMMDDRIRKGVEEGWPLKETLGHLPLLNTSKRTLNAYLNNFKNILSHRSGPVELITEKGVSSLSRESIRSASLRRSHHQTIALITTLPEKNLMGRNRSADQMVSVLSELPKLVETLSHRLLSARENGTSIKDLMSWLPGEIDDMSKRSKTLRDAENIFKENYLTTIVHHLRHLECQEEGEENSNFLYDPVSIDSRDVLGLIALSGEYRDILAFDDTIHRDIHQLFKHGKPDANIEWGRAVNEDFEFNGCRISSITNNADLSQEGVELNHCVGTYLRAILENESYIFSVKKDGKRVSTIEIKEGFDGDNNFEIIQHYAYGNSTPPEDAIEAAEGFLEAINEGGIAFERSPCEHGSIDEFFEEGMETERQELEFGLRFSNRDFVLHTIDSMQRILPSFDVWEALGKEGISNSRIEDIRADYERAYGVERSLEGA